jgi:Methyltransferase domain
MSDANSESENYRYPDPCDAITGHMITSLSESKRWEAEEEAVLAQLTSRIEQLHAPRSLLDVGAGEGRLALRLGSHFQRMVLFEPDEERSRRIPDVMKQIDKGALSYRILRRRDEMVTDSPYDVVLISHVVQHVAFGVAVNLVLESMSLCRSGGVIYLATNLSANDHRYHAERLSDAGEWTTQQLTRDAFDDLAAHPTDVLPIHSFPAPFLCSLFQDGGVETLSVLPFHRVAQDSATGAPEHRDVAVIGRKTQEKGGRG